MKKITLASQSPWRKKLLSWIGIDCEVRVSDFDEKSTGISDPYKLAKILAEKKAEIVSKEVGEGVVIGADTMIVLPKGEEYEVIGKPKDMSEAREILKKLRNREHVVLTGVCVIGVEKNKKLVELDETRVVFGDFTERDLEDYLETGDSIGKAGAYQFIKVQEKFISSFKGSVSGVIGLPIKRTLSMLEKIGMKMDVDNEKIMLRRIGYKD